MERTCNFFKPTCMRAIWVGIIFLFLLVPAASRAAEPLTVAYYPGWPCTYQVGQAQGWFQQELGIPVYFKPFHHPGRIAYAMKTGEIELAMSLGITPFTAGVTRGIPYRLIGIAVSYAEIDTCVSRPGAGIRSPKDLVGRRVGVPFESVSHYKLLVTLGKYGIDRYQVEIYDMTPEEVVAAMRWGEIDCGCAWEPAVSAMLALGGSLIVSPAEQERWGLRVFDIIAARTSLIRRHPELLVKFLEVVDASTRYYRAHEREAARLIAGVAGISPDAAERILRKMQFLTKEEQIDPSWLGTREQPGEVVGYLAEMARFLKEQGAIDSVLPDYGFAVDSSFYEALP